MIQPVHANETRLDKQAADWLTRLNNDDISPEEQAAFNRWLSQSPQHQTAYKNAMAQRQKRETSGNQYDHQAGNSFEEELTATCHMQRPLRAHRALKLMLAASILATLVLLVHPSWLSTVTADYRTGNSELSHYSLPDGSRLTLHSNSSLDINFTAGQRQIMLYRGEVLFEVSRDPQRPFTVHSPHGNTQVLGTTFNITTSPQSTRVDVLEGTVQVSAQGGQQRTLNARMYQRFNDHFVNDPQNASDALQRIEGWQQGQLIVRNQTLDDVVAQLNRHFDGYLVLRNDELASHRISGVFSLRNRDTAIEQLRQQLGLQRQDLPGLTLLSRG